MGKNYYLKNDGNGGLSISKRLALIISILTITAFLVNIVYGYGTLNEKVSIMQDEIVKAQTIHPLYVADQEIRMDKIEKEHAILKEKVINIDENVKYIRENIGG